MTDGAPMEEVILVDRSDREIGRSEKMTAHIKGWLHRAFSVFVFDDRGFLLLQRRAESKYHTPGLWTNTCCSHPRPGEQVLYAGRRRLREEMGFSCDLSRAFSFLYHARFPNGLVEHELDHVLVGHWNGTPSPDPGEVRDWRWVASDVLTPLLLTDRQLFTPWFVLAYTELVARDAAPPPFLART
ncbi:MAG: isopentenyl-diphosphate Delta-isomerase [Gemmatimonadetes bacterium]|nr:isopentenyl-diphosphate Delta-isomerase [Gemmatimonadota bacterium]